MQPLSSFCARFALAYPGVINGIPPPGLSRFSRFVSAVPLNSTKHHCTAGNISLRLMRCDRTSIRSNYGNSLPEFDPTSIRGTTYAAHVAYYQWLGSTECPLGWTWNTKKLLTQYLAHRGAYPTQLLATRLGGSKDGGKLLV